MSTTPHPPTPPTTPPPLPDPLIQPRRSYRYYDLVMAGFVTVLLCSNIIGPGKSCAVTLWGTTIAFGAGNIFFPISYIFGDILTEVYGYARTRKVIWAGFGAMLFYVLMSQVVIHLPVNPAEPFNQVMQPAIEVVFGAGPRIVAASILAFWLGDFTNSYVMAKMKVWSHGRFLWMRTIGSTMVGQGVDSIVFYPLAFASIEPLFGKENLPAFLQGGWTMGTIMAVATFNWIFKVGVEVVMTPFTYAICNFLKRAENEDYYDRQTNFTPFSLKD
ncbi:MAG: queuosine precursor transporter [Phycisphaerales bacterium]|nr:queuosine precursor transporter [Phycisphaerales bacterium]